jgi:hypothetical protein
VVAALLGSALAPATALPQSDIPGSGVDEYVEGIPGAGGRHVPGTKDRGRANGSDLPASTRRSLSGDAEGRSLQQLATDPSLGAPRPSARKGKRAAAAAAADVRSDSVPTAVKQSFSDSSNGGLTVFIALLLVTLAGLVAAALRLRGRRSAS